MAQKSISSLYFGQSVLCFPALEMEGGGRCFDHFVCCCQAFLLNEDLGDSLDSVEALLKKHEDFEKSLSAQEEKITVRPLVVGAVMWSLE